MVEPVMILSISIGIVSGLALITERLIVIRSTYIKHKLNRMLMMRELEGDRVGLVNKFYRELILKYPD